MRMLPAVAGIPIILTTASKAALESLVGLTDALLAKIEVANH
jgi:hypothetical protein